MPALAAIPVMAAIVAVSPGFLSGLPIRGDASLASGAIWGAALYLGALLFALALCMVVALPGIVICRRLSWERWWVAALTGAATGWLGLAMVSKAMFKRSLPLHAQLDVLDEPKEALLLVTLLAVGAAAGLVFWWFVHAVSRSR